MADELTLSVCIPSFNRAKELRRLFASVPSGRRDIELVICDDGSTDSTSSVVAEYGCDRNIRYIYQVNAGRAAALHSAVSHSTGAYVVLMDSDDYFVEGGLDVILQAIRVNRGARAFVFGVRITSADGSATDNVPPNVETNFVALRADLKVRRDLKEVVDASVVKAALYRLTPGVRRVPTYLLWSAVAHKAPCRGVSSVVAVKEYLPGGMSAKILELKVRDSGPMVDLYDALSESKLYKSGTYRWRSRVLWARHAFHAGRFTLTRWWSWLVFVPGALMYGADKIRLRVSD